MVLVRCAEGGHRLVEGVRPDLPGQREAKLHRRRDRLGHLVHLFSRREKQNKVDWVSPRDWIFRERSGAYLGLLVPPLPFRGQGRKEIRELEAPGWGILF